MAFLAASGATSLVAMADDFAPPATAEAPTSALAQFQQSAKSAFSDADSQTAPSTAVAVIIRPAFSH